MRPFSFITIITIAFAVYSQENNFHFCFGYDRGINFRIINNSIIYSLIYNPSFQYSPKYLLQRSDQNDSLLQNTDGNMNSISHTGEFDLLYNFKLNNTLSISPMVGISGQYHNYASDLPEDSLNFQYSETNVFGGGINLGIKPSIIVFSRLIIEANIFLSLNYVKNKSENNSKMGGQSSHGKSELTTYSFSVFGPTYLGALSLLLLF